jgi:hypothetical protein
MSTPIICLTSLKLAVTLIMLLPLAANAQVSKEQIIGTWTLTSWTRVVGDTEEPGPLGSSAIGFIMYTTDGHMCGNGMRPDRPKFASRDFRGGSIEEKAAAFETYFGYCARYEVDESKGVVTHIVAVSSFPNFTGTEQKRFVTVSGDRMTITTPPVQVDGKQTYSILRWERAR